jgi:hypothetical protein
MPQLGFRNFPRWCAEEHLDHPRFDWSNTASTDPATRTVRVMGAVWSFRHVGRVQFAWRELAEQRSSVEPSAVSLRLCDPSITFRPQQEPNAWSL